jgi:4-diphosphocytidyl-2-C-methyl-D-erythritol kinase
MPAPPLSVRAFAKINLSLRIVGTRPDGFHELQTVYQSVALHDTLRFVREAGPFRLSCDDPACPADRTNLVWRAADAVWRAAGRRGRPGGIAVRLVKRIPAAAGLGGGSSDAAATLRVLAPLWGVRGDRLPAIAAALGADVPYFLSGGTAVGLERGDVVLPLADAPPVWIVLVLPPFGVRTDEAYAWWDRHPSRGARADRWGTNDLQAPVASRHPEIGRMVRALGRAGAQCAAMTGSGSTTFGLFDREADARAAAMRLTRSSRRTIVTRTVTRARCLSGTRGFRPRG